MFYHIHFESKEKDSSGRGRRYQEYDHCSDEKIINKILVPYLLGEKFQVDGYFLNINEVSRVKIIATKNAANEETSQLNQMRRATGGTFYIATNKFGAIFSQEIFANVTDELLDKAKVISKNSKPQETVSSEKLIDNKKIFIVHGQDDAARLEVSLFLTKLGLEPIVLHEQANGGLTIIEKLEEHTDVGFGIVIYTPCDIGAKQSSNPDYQPRARQNVVFEHGLLIGKLSRKRVCALVKGDLEKPNDISGILYINQDYAGAWKSMLTKELIKANYDVDMTKFL
ncbi:TPA: TIR domain-containing protein [Yersinia enterocolitica]